jgi:hypothetical protein
MGIGEVIEETLRPVEQVAPGISQCQCTRRSNQETDAKVLLQSVNLADDG